MYITHYISTCAASLSFISVIFSKCEAPSFSRACAAARSWQQAPQVSGAVLFFYFFFTSKAICVCTFFSSSEASKLSTNM